jgi:class 3 adenylate cyclase
MINIQSLSLYTMSATRLPGTGITQTSSVPSLLAISHSIEETVAHHELDSYFFAGFQRISAFLPQVNRFRTLATRCRKVYVFGIADSPAPSIPNLEYIFLEPDAPLSKEWFIIFEHPRFHIALLTHEIGESASSLRDTRFGRGRLYQGFVTLEETIVQPAAQALQQALQLADPHPNHRSEPELLPPVNSYLNYFSTYMERAQSELTALYQNLKDRTDALERLESIIRTMVSRRAWDDSLNMLQNSVTEAEQPPQRRTLSILFTDIQQFTPLFERYDPTFLTEILNRYFDLITTTIYEEHGDIDKFLGDGLLAFFSEPTSAVRAAAVIQRRLQAFNQQQAAHLSLHLDTRIGIATGECMIAKIGSTMRREITILGDAVNFASRLQAIAPANGLSVDEKTYRAIGSPPRCNGRDMQIKGKGLQRVYTTSFENLLQILHNQPMDETNAHL